MQLKNFPFEWRLIPFCAAENTSSENIFTISPDIA